MTTDRVGPADGYWIDDLEPGTSSTWRFEGEDGLRRLSGPSTVRAAAPATFLAQLTRVQLDHVAFEAFRATAHTSVRGQAELAAGPTPLLTFIALIQGRLRVELTTAVFTLEPDGCVVVDSRDPVSFTADEDVRMIRAVVGIEHLPPGLERHGATIARPLERSALIESYIAFAASLLRSTAAGRPARGPYLLRAAADLQVAVLSEARSRPDPEPGAAGLRHRIEAHIDQRFHDSDLTPASIAREFRISIRHVHAVFEGADRTVAQLIRDRRVGWVAAELRRGPAPRFNDLARMAGFSSRDVLTRAFQQRFGMTPSDYRDGGYRHFVEG